MSLCKTYYAIYRKSPTQENPWNLSLIVITENPQAVGEFVSATAQTEAINFQLDADDENPNLSYRWYENRLVMKICVNPYRFRAIYFAKTHHNKTLEVLFDNAEIEEWFDDMYHNHSEYAEYYYKDFSNRVIDGNETEYKIEPYSARSVQYTLHKVQFPIGVMT
jgi:hypothetical protein